MPAIGESRIAKAAEEFLRKLDLHEEKQRAEMVKRYLGVERRLRDQMEALTEQLARLALQGQAPSMGQLYRLERWNRLLESTLRELAEFNSWASGAIASGQGELAGAGAEDALRALKLAGVRSAFESLPTAATATAAGYAADGSPLAELLAQAFPDVAQEMAQRLINGTALGYNPRKVAADMSKALGTGLDRAFLIARTEQLRSYRHAALGRYAAAGLEFYQRVATHDERVCIGCLATDGRVYPIAQDFDAHPACRCRPIPFNEDLRTTVQPSRGSDWFDTLDEAAQRDLMGPGRFDLWQEFGGTEALQWKDLAVRKVDPDWGGSMHPKTVGDLREELGLPRRPVPKPKPPKPRPVAKKKPKPPKPKTPAPAAAAPDVVDVDDLEAFVDALIGGPLDADDLGADYASAEKLRRKLLGLEDAHRKDGYSSYTFQPDRTLEASWERVYGQGGGTLGNLIKDLPGRPFSRVDGRIRFVGLADDGTTRLDFDPLEAYLEGKEDLLRQAFGGYYHDAEYRLRIASEVERERLFRRAWTTTSEDLARTAVRTIGARDFTLSPEQLLQVLRDRKLAGDLDFDALEIALDAVRAPEFVPFKTKAAAKKWVDSVTTSTETKWNSLDIDEVNGICRALHDELHENGALSIHHVLGYKKTNSGTYASWSPLGHTLKGNMAKLRPYDPKAKLLRDSIDLHLKECDDHVRDIEEKLRRYSLPPGDPEYMRPYEPDYWRRRLGDWQEERAEWAAQAAQGRKYYPHNASDYEASRIDPDTGDRTTGGITGIFTHELGHMHENVMRSSARLRTGETYRYYNHAGHEYWSASQDGVPAAGWWNEFLSVADGIDKPARYPTRYSKATSCDRFDELWAESFALYRRGPRGILAPEMRNFITRYLTWYRSRSGEWPAWLAANVDKLP